MWMWGFDGARVSINRITAFELSHFRQFYSIEDVAYGVLIAVE